MNKISTKEEHIYHMDLSPSVSWKTADTVESIPVHGSARETFPVYLLCPDGKKIKEECYAGDGKFGEKDVFALLATWNWSEHHYLTNGRPESCSLEARSKVYGENRCLVSNGIKFPYPDFEHPVKLVRNPKLNYEDVDASELCEFEGWNYDIKELPASSEVLNKYSLKNVLTFFNKIGSPSFVEVQCFIKGKYRSEVIHRMLGYADGSNGSLYVRNTMGNGVTRCFELNVLLLKKNIMYFLGDMIACKIGFQISSNTDYWDSY